MNLYFTLKTIETAISWVLWGVFVLFWIVVIILNSKGGSR